MERPFDYWTGKERKVEAAAMEMRQGQSMTSTRSSLDGCLETRGSGGKGEQETETETETDGRRGHLTVHPNIYWRSTGAGTHICFVAGVARGGVICEGHARQWYLYPRVDQSERIGPFAYKRQAQECGLALYFIPLLPAPSPPCPAVLAASAGGS